MKCKGCGRKHLWPTSMYCTGMCVEGLRKPGKTLRMACCRFYTYRVVRSRLCHRYSMIVLLHSTALPLQGTG